ncbi:MAG: LPP20 family lipoprotein [Deltaproteobacteria bacterium]|nr:LPP20 family lipoprotein [Deltaproteobacteria bacterium]MBN2671890.1 LPP20 family lipoprotein [Deltaproteobacteria bacterium]
MIRRYAFCLAIVFSVGCAATKPAPCAGEQCSKPTAAPDSSRHDNRDADGAWQEVNSPDWVATGGDADRYPHDTYLTGIAMASGEGGLKRAMADAAADLANRISVRIEHEFTDASTETNGRVDYHVAAITRMSSDVRLSGLQYEISHQGDSVYALAYVEKAQAAAQQKLLRDQAVQSLRECMVSARKRSRSGKSAEAAMAYLSCMRHLVDGLQHDAVVRTITQRGTNQVQMELVSSLQRIRDASSELVSRPATSLKEAADFLAVQLSAAGDLGNYMEAVAPFRYGTTNFSSSFGQQIALHLESALGKRLNGNTASGDSPQSKFVIQGVYFQEGENIRLSATARNIDTGALQSGAEALIAKSRIPTGIALFPKNLENAMVEQRLLSEGELVDGKLRVEIWADKGRRGVVYTEHEEIRIFIRVNAPAYVRLIYVLESGIQVPIDQGYYIDGTKVNMAVEYPDRFEVVPPFGIEHIHATAFTKPPAPLPVATRVIDGETYEVVADGLASLVRHRGIKRKKKEEVAESLISISTLPRTETPTH